MKTRVLLAFLFTAGLVLAAPGGSRLITITGGSKSGNPRTGPFEYSGNVVAKIQELNIAAGRATLASPQGEDITAAEGKRIATFTDGVKVSRGSLTATGPSLVYRESNGVGTLSGGIRTVQKPEKATDDDVIITANEASFDVDSDRSTSRGNVRLVNGGQSGEGDQAVYEEDRQLAVITDAQKVTLVRKPSSKKPNDDDLVINAREARLLNSKKQLIATGGVTLTSGDNTTSGDSLYYDDTRGVAYVVGRPARNVNKKTNSTISNVTIENNTRKNQVSLSRPFTIPSGDFKLQSEK